MSEFLSITQNRQTSLNFFNLHMSMLFSLKTDMRKHSYRGKWLDPLRIRFSPVFLFLINLHKHTTTNEARIIKTIGQIMMSAFVVESKELGGGVCVVERVVDVEGGGVDGVVCFASEQLLGISHRY